MWVFVCLPPLLLLPLLLYLYTLAEGIFFWTGVCNATLYKRKVFLFWISFNREIELALSVCPCVLCQSVRLQNIPSALKGSWWNLVHMFLFAIRCIQVGTNRIDISYCCRTTIGRFSLYVKILQSKLIHWTYSLYIICIQKFINNGLL